MDRVRTILHVDMDAFYASVEQRDDPALRGRPVLVGGTRERGVVAAASYEARVFGVRSAMPMAMALRKCPEAIVVPGRHSRYAEVSRSVFAIFHRFTPLVEALSLDEAFLDVTGSFALYGSGETIARRIKDAITSELSLTASAGVAPSKFVAKIASDLKKPDGLVVVAPDDVASFLAALPIERMWGLGPKGAAHARAYGLTTLGDLARAPRSELESLFGRHGPGLGDLARGEDPREVVPDREAKSIGSEETFEHDLDARELPPKLLFHAMRVAERLHANDLVGRTVTVKVKHADFTQKTRSHTFDESAADTDTIYEAARTLLSRFELGGVKVRLVGVQVSGLEAANRTQSLFPDESREKRKKLEAIAANVRERFGRDAITRATLLDSERKKEK